MTIRKIAFIGFGEVGQTLASDLAERSRAALAAFDVKFLESRAGPFVPAEKTPAISAPSPSACVAGADLIISAVTAGSTLDAAHSAADAMKPAAWYFDVNSASPQTKIEAADAVEMAGGRYVEASIMSPISPRRIEAPILLGGPHAQDFEAVAKALGFRNAAFYSQERGKAAAAKLCRSVVVKGIEALISESMLAARHYGVERDVIASLDDLLPHPDWREHARYMISRTLQHGARRAEEMQEAARAIADAGVEPWMANATVMRQAFAGALDLDHHAGDLEVLVDAMRARIASMSREAGVTP